MEPPTDLVAGRQLLECIQDDDACELEEKIMAGQVGPNQRRAMTSPLAAAAFNGSLNCMKVLLDHGADVDLGGRSGQPPLTMAVKGNTSKQLQIMQLLIEKGAKIDTKYVNGNTALLDAITLKESDSGYLEKAMFLIDAGANIHIRNNAGDSSLHLATARGRFHIVERLLAAGVSPNISQTKGLKKKKDTGITPLHIAATVPHTVFDNTRVANLLINAGGDVNARREGGPTPLHYAAYYAANNVADLLLSSGAEVDALCDANEYDAGNSIWSTPLALAVHQNHIDMAQKLLDAGVVVDRPDYHGNTPIVHAALTRKEAMCRTLIRGGCDVNITCLGLTSVLYGILESLLKRRDTNIAKVNTIKVVSMLVKAGARVGPVEEEIILRAITMVEGIKEEQLLNGFGSDSFMYVALDDLDSALENLNIILANGKNPSLKQISRLCVTKRLKENRLLPKVIFSVPLPSKLQECVAFCDI